jgi:hypothetical protein
VAFRPRVHALAVAVLAELLAAARWAWRTSVDFTRTAFEGISFGFNWTVRTSDLVGLSFRTWLSAKFAVLSANARILVQGFIEGLSIGWAWIRFWSRRCAAALRKRVEAGRIWAEPRMATLERTLLSAAQASFAWSRHNAEALARMLARTAAVASSWTVATSSALWLGMQRKIADLRRARAERSKRHRALVIRPCTALMCIEPWRVRLPTLRAG